MKDRMRRIHKIHFVGIGGSGMNGIAELLVNLGYAVSGSDARASAVTARLASMGARIFEGHAASQVGDADVVVSGSDGLNRSVQIHRNDGNWSFSLVTVSSSTGISTKPNASSSSCWT